jgi:hypothetical protein
LVFSLSSHFGNDARSQDPKGLVLRIKEQETRLTLHEHDDDDDDDDDIDVIIYE